ncbi:B3/4 domain-containing protein [Variovorax sp. OV329]|uniref:B3/B4 domain-containing protein n=1 Tax=Variovorax sp. OV329 TaxID=1882825 RepID=UPI0008E59516|nr:phenylalanine--tRNA ligase beta subunit-related protein [Variovorax sp. OV329]SFM98139.1 phosphoenolpyruvate synthase [Variovorax sp. OV329]
MSLNQFSHADEIWAAHPGLAVLALHVRSLAPDASAPAAQIAALHEQARVRLAAGPEGEFPEIQAWRRAFSRMGLKPTQYRCAAESLLRRFRKDDALPALHPLVDACNAASLAHAIPIAVFDLAQVDGSLQVRPATGEERHLAFGGEAEQPEPGEVVFADEQGHAHARRWCHRQSVLSTVRPATTEVLIVAEAMHDGASQDLDRLQQVLAALLDALGGRVLDARRLQRASPALPFARA